MPDLQELSLDQIESLLDSNHLPFSGTTSLGSAEFHITEPAGYLGVAIHAGHRVRKEILDIMAVSEDDRLREEDPHTDLFIRDFPIRIIARDSRFEYDLNREEERSIYSSERGIWGLKVWSRKLTARERNDSLQKHREFHNLLDLVIKHMLKRHKRVLVFDMHSYCYQRKKKQPWYEDSRPEINVGTRAVNRGLFGQVIDAFMDQVSGIRIDGHPIRVAENEIFPGGYLSRRLSKAWYDRVLVLALEYKKIFMDEWSGELYDDKLKSLVEDFNHTVRKIHAVFRAI